MNVSLRPIRAVHVVLAGLLGSLLAAPPAAAQRTAEIEPPVARTVEFPLTIRNIMRGSELVGESPAGVRWTDDSRWIYFRWRPGGGEWSDDRELYRVPAEGGEPELLEEAAADTLEVLFAEGDLSADRSRRVSAVQGDLYLVERSTLDVRRLTETVEGESEPRFSRDGSTVFFVRDDDAFALRLDDGSVRQLTDIREGPEPEEPPEAEGHRAFLEAQQQELFEAVRLEKEREEEREAREERREARTLETFWTRRNERVADLAPSPTGSHVAATLVLPPRDELSTVVPEWVTESGYTEDLEVRSKVGDVQGDVRFGVVDAATGEMTLLDLVPGDDEEEATPEEEPDAEAGAAEGEEEGRRSGGGEELPDLAQVRFAGWNDAGTHGLVLAVDFDYKAWRLYAFEAASGELTLLDALEDEAWVGGPCFASCIGWIPGTDRAWYVSEETGWSHLYAVDADGSDPEALTEGAWEVLEVTIPEQEEHFVITTSEVSPFDQHVYTMGFDGSDRTRLTEGPGSWELVPSPDGARAAVVHGRANRPPELFVARYGEALGEPDQVTVSPTAEWLTFPWIRPDIVEVPAEDGTAVPGRVYRPSDLGARPNGAGVVFVHGAGYLHNVHNWWSSYYREYMFHHYLAAQGYTVLDLDYRGSAGYGRDWRTAVYRWMGGKDLSDQVDGARWLVAEEGVDPARIGIYGGSYGGFITLMALFTAPDVFEAGAALRSVTDWAHYNHWYTSRILNLPHEDEEAYRKSSPIYFAEDFEGHLLMAHGMVDTNVHFSDVVRLSQRLIELGKENWELAVYPVESHGFAAPASWTDEYRRIFELFDRTIGEGQTVVRPRAQAEGGSGPGSR